MELPLEPLISDLSDHSPAWEKAADKVVSYLEAHGFRSRILRDRLLYSVLRGIPDEGGERAAGQLEQVAIEAAERRLLQWFRTLFPDTPESRLLARGRLALLMDGRFERHLQLLQEAPGSVPEDLQSRMHVSVLHPSPGMRVTSMPPPRFEPGPIFAAAGETKKFFERVTIVRLAVSWLIFLGLLGLIFVWTR